MAAASPSPGAAPAAARLRPLLPATLAGWTRQSLALPEPTLGPAIAPAARAEYRRAKQVATVDVSDLTAAPPPPWTGDPLERATESGRERVRRDGDRTVREETGGPGQRNSVSLALRNGIVIGASGLGVPIAELRKLAEAIDLKAAEQLGRR